MGAIRVASLKIKNFRRFKNIEIAFEKNVTLIAGQNGTSKSTLLGMLAQPFSFGVIRGDSAGKDDRSAYIDNYHGLPLHDFIDLTGKHFMYDCDDVFRLSRANDVGKTYEYKTKLECPAGTINSLPDNSLLTKARPRTKDSKVVGMRFVTGPGTSHEGGEGNFPHPVIYLGLNRLWPLAMAKKCEFPVDTLSDENKKWYVQNYSHILCLDEQENQAKYMDTREKKRFVTPESKDYDGESCSAGQDNLSQILTAVLSFLELKKKLGDKYRGGMLLIDELDATLHAFSQDKLLELLCEVSLELELQVIATSHSLLLLERAYKSKLRNNIQVVYLMNQDGRVVEHVFDNYQKLSDHLNVKATPPSKNKPNKVSVVLEDKEAKYLFKQICGSKLNSYVRIFENSSFGAGDLKNLANLSKKLPDLQNIIFIPDGDMARTWKNPPGSLLPLPGLLRPETLVFRLLFNMKEADPFWVTPYTRQYAITSKEGISLEKGDDKKWVKSWYDNQSSHWGRANQKVFKAWTRANKEDCLAFCEKFIALLKGRYKGDIPQELIDKIRAQFE